MEGFPGFLVDLGIERRLEGLVRVVGAEEVGVADKKALFVVVGVDEPAGNAVGVVATDFAGVGVEHIDAVDLDLDLTLLRVEDVNVRFAEDDEKIALAGVLEVVGHVEVGVHARLENGDATKLVELRGMGLIVERAGDQHVEVCICGLARGLYEIGTRDGTEFRANEDASALFGTGVGVAFDVDSFGTDEVAGPGFDRRERDAIVFVRLLDAGGFEIAPGSFRRSPAFRRSRACFRRRCR